jgi:hypothetical protein
LENLGAGGFEGTPQPLDGRSSRIRIVFDARVDVLAVTKLMTL